MPINPAIIVTGILKIKLIFNASFLYYNIEDFTNSMRLSKNLVSLNSKDERYQIQLIQNLEKIGSKEDLISAINFARSELEIFSPSSTNIVDP